jgi:hypothetical protein
MSLAFDDNGLLDSDGGSQPYVITNGVAYAVGLIWRRLATPANPKSEIKEGADSAGNADLHCLVRDGEVVGFASTSRGHRKDMPALFGVLDPKIANGNGNWIAAFDLDDDGVYLVAVHSGKVIEDGLFDKKTAESRCSRLYSSNSGQWDVVIAPDRYRIKGAKQEDLAELVGKTRKPRLKAVKSGGKKIVLLLLALMLGGGAYGWTVYQDRLAQEAEELMRQQLEANLPQQKKIEIPPPPWVVAGSVPGGDLVKGCSSAINQRMLAVAGWGMQSVICTKDGATQTLARRKLAEGGAPVTWIKDSVHVAGMKASVSPLGGDLASLSWSLPTLLKPIEKDVPKVLLNDAKRFMLTSFEHAFVPIQFGTAASDQFYSTQSFTFETQFDPATFAQIFDYIPTLAIDSVEYSPELGTYKVAGKIFEALEVNVNAVK